MLVCIVWVAIVGDRLEWVACSDAEKCFGVHNPAAPGVMLMLVAHYHLMPWEYPWSGLQPKALLKYSWALLPPEVMLLSIGQDFTRDRNAVHGLCCSREIIDALLPETMLRSVACADAGDYVDVHDVCCCKKSCGGPWSLLPLTTKFKESCSCSDIHDCRPTVQKGSHRRLLGRTILNPPYSTTQNVRAKQETIKENFINLW